MNIRENVLHRNCRFINVVFTIFVSEGNKKEDNINRN